MDTNNFLTAVLPDTGWYALLTIRADDGKRVQKLYESIDAVTEAAHQYDKNDFDTYFALSSFVTGENRKVENVKHVNALFLDIDCGEIKAAASKGYIDQQAGVAALRAFCKKLKLPKPTIVNSGRGLHVYWILNNPSNYSEWLPVAERLKHATKREGLICDPAVTSDAARVLRIPQTHNHKDNPPKPVTMLGGELAGPVDLDEFCKLLGNEPILMPTVTRKAMSAAESARQQLLMGNQQGRFKTIMDKTIKKEGCEQLRIIMTDQANIDEPLWRAGLSIAKHCVDWEIAAERMSCNHPDYDEAETQNKLDLIKGPYLCTTFDEFNPGVCEHCPHNGSIKTPLLLGREIIRAEEKDSIVPVEPERVEQEHELAATVVKVPEYPKPYFRGKNGGVYEVVHDSDGNSTEMLVYEHDLYVVTRLMDAEMGECAVVRLHLPHDPMREVNIPLSTISNTTELKTALSKQGVVAHHGGWNNIMSYIQNWVKELQIKSTAGEARRQFGWTKNCEAFVVGNKEYTKDGVNINHASSKTLNFFPAFEPKGTLQGWKDMINFYNKPGLEGHQLIVCSSFASVLMEFIPNISAAGLHVYSKDSGFGKTTAMLAGNTVWGNPTQLILSDNDTKNMRMNRAETYKNLPLYVDEITNAEPKELSDLAYELTGSGGVQRGRLQGSANQERVRGEGWSFLAVSSGNTSFIERISMEKEMPKAEAQRIMEYHVEGFSFDGGPLLTEDFNRDMIENYGHAGPIFIKSLLENPERTIRLMATVRAKLTAEFNLTMENRFWAAYWTCVISALIICRGLHLLEYDVDNMFRFAGELIDMNRNSSATEHKTAKEHLSEFVNAHYHNLLVVDSEDLFGNTGLASHVPNNNLPRGEIIGRYEQDSDMLYVMKNKLGQWCKRQQINFAAFLRELEEQTGAKTEYKRLLAGTKVKSSPARVISVNYRHETDD